MTTILERLRGCMLQNVPANQTSGTCSSLPYDAADIIEGLAIAAGRLVVATDGMDALRYERQAVLEALRDVASVDTHAKRRDVEQARPVRVGSAVAATGGETPND